MIYRFPWVPRRNMLVLACLGVLLAAHAPAGAENSFRVVSLKEIRERGVVMQAWESSCAAAVATVLTHLAEQSVALDKELAGLFAAPSPASLEAARELVRKLQFLDKCRRDAEELDAAIEGHY